MCMWIEGTELYGKQWKNRPSRSGASDQPGVPRAKACAASCSASSVASPSRNDETLPSRPTLSTLNHVQERSRVVRNRWRWPMEALPTHSGAADAQLASFSGRLQATTKLCPKPPMAAFSSFMPGCTTWPLATHANTLKGATLPGEPTLRWRPSSARRPLLSRCARKVFAPPMDRMCVRAAANPSASEGAPP